jgi:parallel beta-helix repeat protein
MKTILSIFIALLMITAPRLLAQGALTPSGPPAPTMFTLSQIEPRTPISSVPITITSPGSYYLTGNLTNGSSTAITIEANNVTIDLNGFTLSGKGSSSGDGIEGGSQYQQLIVRNGTIQGCFNGVDASVMNGGTFEKVAFISNRSYGLTVASRFLVKDCECISNNYGIDVDGRGTATVLLNNNCSFNTNSGFSMESEGNRAEGNIAIGNAEGFSISSANNLIIHNFAQGNTQNYPEGADGPIITGSLIGNTNTPFGNFSF